MTDFDPAQGLRRHIRAGFVFIAIGLFPIWVGWHIVDLALGTWKAGATRADVLRIEPANAEKNLPEGVWLRFTDEAGETKTELLYPDEDDPPETRQVGARPWIWYVSGRPNMTQFTQGEVMVRWIFGSIGLPPILGGLGLWFWAWRTHAMRKRALASWPRQEASLPRVEFSRLDQIVPSPVRRWRLAARVFHEAAWHDVHSAYVMSLQVPEFAPEAKLVVLVDPANPRRHWLPIPAGIPLK
ncbi:hypothetical protein [Arenimonas sp.]|uniref:hypothetical protein n=1 Tax=Arenimonas sp. TaxID=1872635 RepID=UPI0039E6ABAD